MDLVGWLLDQGCEFIPDLHYDSNSFQNIADLTAIQELAESVALFHVVRPDFIESPILPREVETTDKHFFYISPRVGGPTLQFYRGRQFEKEGNLHLSCTFLSFYPWYENSLTGAHEKPPQALRDLYAEFAKTVGKSRRKIKPGQRANWISPTAERLVRSGSILVGLEDLSIEQILGAPSVENS
jgi:hypothetical protein